jgi:hypothetical protein
LPRASWRMPSRIVVPGITLVEPPCQVSVQPPVVHGFEVKEAGDGPLERALLIEIRAAPPHPALPASGAGGDLDDHFSRVRAHAQQVLAWLRTDAPRPAHTRA